MAATSRLLCKGCTDSSPLSTQNTTMLQTLDLHISVPGSWKVDATGLLANSLCSHCSKKPGFPSPLDIDPRLFTTNRPLLAVEEDVLSSRRRIAKEELSVMRAVILTFEQELTQLKQHRDALESSISQYDRLLSPIRRLPADVLVEIARYTLSDDNDENSHGAEDKGEENDNDDQVEDDDNDEDVDRDDDGDEDEDKSDSENDSDDGDEDPAYRHDSLDVKNGIWPLSQVCSAWRAVLINAPALWSKVNITQSHPLYAPSILFETLKRSQCVPLDVSFRSEETELSRIIFQTLCSQSHRWRSLKLLIHSSHWPCLGQVRNTLIQLRSAELDLLDDKPFADVTSTSNIFAVAPKLEHVRLGMYQDGFALPTCLQFPMESVVDFTIWIGDRLRHPRILDMIPHSTVNLVIGGEYSLQFPSYRNQHPAIYPSVTDLRLEVNTSLLGALTCPRLEKFTVYAVHFNQEQVQHLQDFITRSVRHHTLTALRLRAVSFGLGSTIPALYQIFSSVTELELEGLDEDDLDDEDEDDRSEIASRHMARLLKTLRTVENQTNYLLPALQTLIVSCNMFDPSTSLYKLIHDVVESRVNPPASYHGEKLSEFRFTDRLTSALGENITLSTYSKLLGTDRGNLGRG